MYSYFSQKEEICDFILKFIRQNKLSEITTAETGHRGQGSLYTYLYNHRLEQFSTLITEASFCSREPQEIKCKDDCEVSILNWCIYNTTCTSIAQRKQTRTSYLLHKTAKLYPLNLSNTVKTSTVTLVEIPLGMNVISQDPSSRRRAIDN